MKIRIELEMSPRVRRILLGLSVPAVLLGGGAVAYAQATTPSTQTANDALIGTALNALGSAVANLQAQVAALQAADHVDRAMLSSGGAVLSQTGSWVKRVEHVTTGKYVIVFTANVFNAIPTCVATPLSDGTPPGVECYGTSQASVTCQFGDVHGPIDVGMSLICAGS